jgi:WD40 repeat protein
MLLSASEDASVKVWDLVNGTVIKTLFGRSTVVWRVAISPDGRLAASGSGDNTVCVWDLATFACVEHLEHPDCVAAVTFSRDNSRLVVGCDNERVYVYERQD